MSVKKVGDRLFVFQFGDKMEKKRVFVRQPWSFNKSLLVLANFEEHTKLEEVLLQWCPFRVQIHRLPLGLMTEKIGIILGETIGEVEEVDVEEGQMVWGRYLRVRVVINIKKPLKKGSKITIPGGDTVIAVIKYEKLPDFCYMCGCLDHQENDCDKVVSLLNEGGKIRREYGPWMNTTSSELL